ncbi:MAG: hypothetical protein H7Z41_02975 [Cytophagales bacterium]|nr:hypothetical protein [Armatimonadota bacterium]
MTNSHLLGFATFGGFALLALLLGVVGKKHPQLAGDPATFRVAAGLVVLGAALGYGAFVLDYGMRVTTLHEEWVEARAGSAARTVAFTVTHPGTVHELFLSPSSDLLAPPRARAVLSVSLTGPGGAVLLGERTERFAVLAGTERDRADWEGRTLSFTPTVAGPHAVRIRPLSPGIPRIQVRLVDPLKRDGERPSGY